MIKNTKIKISIVEQDGEVRTSTITLPEELDAYYMRENLKTMVDEITYHPAFTGKIHIEIETIK